MRGCDFQCLIETKQTTGVSTMLAEGVDPDETIDIDGGDVLPLAYAISVGSESIAKVLIDSGASLADERFEFSALNYAIKYRENGLVQYLLKRDLVTKEDMSLALTEAASIGNYDGARQLLAAGANSNTVEASGVTSLYSALWGGNEDMLSLLIEEGANLKLATTLGPPSAFAVANSNPWAVSQIVPQYRDSPNSPALWGSALGNCRHQSRVMKALEVARVPQCSQEWSKDHAAAYAEKGRQSRGQTYLSLTSQTLLDSIGAECWQESSYSRSQSIDTNESAEQILRTRSDVRKFLVDDNQKDVVRSLSRGLHACADDYSVFHDALVLGLFQVLNHLVMSDWFQTCKDELGLSPAHYAVLTYDIQALSELISEDPASFDLPDRLEFTPLAFALAFGDERLARRLLESGANVNQRTAFGQNMAHFMLIGDSHLFEPDVLGDETKYHQVDSWPGRTPYQASVAGSCPATIVARVPLTKKDICNRDQYGRNAYDYLKAADGRQGKESWAYSVIEYLETNVGFCSSM